jgi:hypothetical protein
MTEPNVWMITGARRGIGTTSAAPQRYLSLLRTRR